MQRMRKLCSARSPHPSPTPSCHFLGYSLYVPCLSFSLSLPFIFLHSPTPPSVDAEVGAMMCCRERKMEEILSERFIHDVLRDHHAWRRALRQCDDPECLAPTTRAAKSNMSPVFRRGCNDNVSTLRFLNCLRSCGDVITAQKRETAPRQRVKDSWNPSTRFCKHSPNLLHNLLFSHLQRRGFLTAYEESRAAVLEEQERRLASQKKRRHEHTAYETAQWDIKRQQYVVLEEAQKRAEIEKSERQRRHSTINIMHSNVIAIFQDTEFNARRAIFQAANAAYTMLQEHSRDALHAITGICPHIQHTYFALLRQEHQQRQHILTSFKRERCAIAKHLHQTIQHQIEEEITRVSAQEQILQRLIQIAAQQHTNRTCN